MFGFLKECNRDELPQYQAGRYLSSNQAFCRICDFKMHGKYSAVQQFAIDVKDGHRVYFTNTNAVHMAQQPKEGTITAFFKPCQVDYLARILLCLQDPSYYTNIWIRSKTG